MCLSLMCSLCNTNKLKIILKYFIIILDLDIQVFSFFINVQDFLLFLHQCVIYVYHMTCCNRDCFCFLHCI